MSFTVTGTYNPYVECDICLEPWFDPVELRPCEHLFCRRCIAKCLDCPDCRAPIQAQHEPSPVLARIAGRTEVRCDLCQWTGTRAEQGGHLTACPKGMGLAAAAFSGGGGAGSTTTLLSGADRGAAKERQARRASAAVVHTPTDPKHADPRRPWITYSLGPKTYERFAAAFDRHATREGSADRGDEPVLASPEAMGRFLADSGRFGPTVSPRDALIFFVDADINRCGRVPRHFAIRFASLNMPPQARKSYRYDADEDDEEEEELDLGGGIVAYGREPQIARAVGWIPDVRGIGGAATIDSGDFGIDGIDDIGGVSRHLAGI
uniref:RING-type domain-containing protein n=1 Tax=Neobodo designis TaxID=312471 RepID=A0A7S1QYW8_NEODS|mmetsp:Transcript_54969/g.169399  ORF Transcript_54969/g.169399 Transcript_54969/m.169399 type:complete len:321 (+) Transcript_54969:50-1012(+)